MAKTFDPKQVSVIVGGHIVQGFADGTFVKVARNNDMFALKVGADGEGARAKSNDKSGTLEITLLQSSASNDVLSGFATSDEISNGGQVPLLVKDGNGTTLVEALTGWVKKKPDVEFGKEISDRVWVFESDKLDMLIGGNV
jgi:hypothetical protein